jgi:DNA-binding transcriptional regulator YiaG
MDATLDGLTAKIRARRDLPEPPVRRMIRKAAGVSLADAADVVGVTRQAVSLWERGARSPRGENLERYLSLLQALKEVC